MNFGSGEGSSNSDPPFAQLGGRTSGGWRDKLGALGAGLVNAGDDDFKKGLQGAGDMMAYYKRRDANKRSQKSGLGGGERQQVRDEAEQFLGNNKSGGF